MTFTKKLLVFLLLSVGLTILAGLWFKPFSFQKSTGLHGSIEQMFSDVYFVTSTNKTTFEGVELQHSCTMTIIKNGKDLTLINTVPLTEEGLRELDALGTVKNVVKIGAFHGKNDAFYLDRYDNAKFWALKGMTDQNGKAIDAELTIDGPMPFPHCSVIMFKTSKFPEAMLHFDMHGGILITCDSIKNWLGPDEYFSKETGKLYQEQGFYGVASISSIWLQACETKQSDFDTLRLLSFKHLITAHGKPLVDNAYECVMATLDKTFGQ